MTNKSCLRVIHVTTLVAVFAGGAMFGSWHVHNAAAQNNFGQPKSVIHVVIYKWKDAVSDAERQKALDGIKDMAGKIPGIKNVWLKTQRNQARNYDGVFAMEFESPETVADYAENPIHEEWSKRWQELRANSLSLQVTNP